MFRVDHISLFSLFILSLQILCTSAQIGKGTNTSAYNEWYNETGADSGYKYEPWGGYPSPKSFNARSYFDVRLIVPSPPLWLPKTH